MAVKIPIITVFDSKGLRQAQFQLNKVSGNVANLSRNFAIAGAAFAGIAVGLGKSVKVASDLTESINAVNVAFGSSAKGILDFGKTAATTLGVSSLDFNNAAVRFSAFADRIVGSGNDATGFIREITTRASDFASVFNIEVSEALQVFQSGLAGEAEPLKRFGINLLETEVKAFAVRTEMIKQGETMTEQQKVLARYGLIMESTNKTAGDFANTSSGLANASRILNAQIVGLQGEIGDALLPAIEQLMPVVQELTFEFGDKLKTAVSSVDWGSVLKSVSDLLVFFVQHIETITKVVTGLFLLNTAYNLGTVAVGIYKAATIILNRVLEATTTSAKLLRTALFLGGVTIAVGSVIDEYRRLKEIVGEANSEVSKFNQESIAVSGAAAKLNPINTLWQNITKSILGAITANRTFRNESGGVSQAVMDSEARRDAAMAARGAGFTGSLPSIPGIVSPVLTGGGGGGGGSVSMGVTGLPAWTANAKKEARVTAKEVQLISKGLSADVARSLIGTNTPIKTANAAIQRINKNGTKAIANLTKSYQNSAAGQQAAAAQASAAAEQASNAAAAAAQAAAEQAAREAAILAEKQRVYEAFAYSVTSTFGRIKDAIVGAFSLPELGGSTDSIIRNMDKLLVRVRAFSQNITKLSDMGLDPKLLQQVINAGPIAGAKLASNLVAGGAGALATINRGFADIGNLASEIGTTGTQATFGTQAQQQIYNVTINGGLDSGPSIGKAVVDAIKAYERTSGVVFQGA